MSAAPATTIRGVAELRAAVGEELGVSPWHHVSQELITSFARVTGDHYWIHVDPTRAAASPIRSTIAHGLFTLSLGPALTDSLVEFEGFDVKLNYGYDRVRFPAPVPVDSRVRMRLQIVDAAEAPGGLRVTLQQRFERDGGTKPVCIANAVMHLGTS